MAEAELQVSSVRPEALRRKVGLRGRHSAAAFWRKARDPLPFFNPNARKKPETSYLARRWNDYAIALIEHAHWTGGTCLQNCCVARSGPNPSCRCAAAEIAPALGPDRISSRWMGLSSCALHRSRSAAHFVLQALMLRAQGKPADAAEILSKLATAYPRDREVQRQLGQTLYEVGRISEAVRAFEAVIAIDPTDANAYQFLSPVYSSQGRTVDAGRAGSLYFLWREDPLADWIGAQLFAALAEWSEERVLNHVHIDQSARRSIQSGQSAAPDRK
jgi:tetratricopeptide (TPR) repeat protein